MLNMIRPAQFVFCMLLMPLLALAQTDPSQVELTREALFHRCYAQLTGHPPTSNHPLLQQVLAGTLDPIDGCMQVLQKAALVPIAQSSLPAGDKTRITPPPAAGYSVFTINDTSDTDAVDVLNKFYNLHRMLFQVQDFSAVPAFYWYGDRTVDATEPAVYLTRLLFAPNVQFKEIVTGNYSVRAIRSLFDWVRVYFTGGSSVYNLAFSGAGFARGKLWGVGVYTAGNKTWMTDTGSTAVTFPVMYWNNTFMSSLRSFGGGIMGLGSYVLTNSGFPAIGRTNDRVSDAGKRMHRRLTRNALKDFLCRESPALRTSDVVNLVANYVQAYPNPANQLPFRTSTNCMACHASIDPMAASFRHIFFEQTDGIPWLAPAEIPAGGGDSPVTAFPASPSLWSGYGGPRAAETPPNGEYTMMQTDYNFYERPPSGDLRYRSYDGSLVWQHISATTEADGLANLGTAMAATNDLYVCMASKYFKYFTGIDANLQDIGDTRFAALSEDDLHYRQIVIDLGLRLKSHQSLSELIHEIFSLPLYHRESYRDLLP